jgi:hypothetical protein
MALHPGLIEGFRQIGVSFFKEASLWWYLAPVFLLWIVLELYFGKYKKEKLGWNTSLGNGISLTWISLESMRFLFQTRPEYFWYKFGVIILIMFYAFLIVYLSFTHKLSAKITYALASPSPMYFLSMVTILWGHGVLIVTWWVLLDLFILYLIIALIFAIIKKVVPESTKDFGEEEDFGAGLGGLDKGLDKGMDKGLGSKIGKDDLGFDKGPDTGLGNLKI